MVEKVKKVVEQPEPLKELEKIQPKPLPKLPQIRESASLESFFGIGKYVSLELRNLKKRNPDIDSMSDEEKARLLFRWLMQGEESIREIKSGEGWTRKSLGYNRDRSIPRYFFVDDKAADCFGSAVLYTAMARRLGLRANFVYVHEGHDGSQHSHACSSVDLNGRTILADATSETQDGFDINHRGWVKMSDREVYFLSMAYHYDNVGNDLFAEGYLRKILDTNPNFVNGWYMLGDIFLMRGDRDSAEKMFERALSLYSRHLFVLNNMADIYLKKGNLSEARGYIDKGLKVNPQNPLLLCTLGEIFEAEKDDENAVKAFIASLENSNPNLPEAQENALAGLQRTSERLMSANGESPFLLTELGRAFVRANEPNRAIAYLARANTLSPNNPNILHLLGRTYELFGDPEKAKKYYRRALKVNPKDEEAREHLRVLDGK